MHRKEENTKRRRYMLKKAKNCEKLRETRTLSTQSGDKTDLPASVLQN